MTPLDALPEHWAKPPFTANELAIIAEAVAAMPTTKYDASVLNGIECRCWQLAFMEVSHNA